MADSRFDEVEASRSKRAKTKMDPSSNPYLAHLYDGSDRNGYSSSMNGSALAGFKRHATTADQAHLAEDGPDNPFSGQPLSSQYFNILRTRRDLPVHKQR
jgi:pre-mRNA-splicing factor ATP-dependent RNA helicase DHX15/PRP43